MSMRKIAIWICAAMMLVGCGNAGSGTGRDRAAGQEVTEQQLRERAEELCGYVPYHEDLERSRGYLTEEFYAVLDTMFCLPDETPVLHEYEFWFCTADGAPVARCNCEVLHVEQTDSAHAKATVRVTPEDGDYDAEEHQLLMTCVDGQWLLADYDGCQAAARRYIDIKRQKE